MVEKSIKLVVTTDNEISKFCNEVNNGCNKFGNTQLVMRLVIVCNEVSNGK